MERLRAPGGCPWDREQTFDSIKPYTLEETYEVLEAIDNRDWDELTASSGTCCCRCSSIPRCRGNKGRYHRRGARQALRKTGESASSRFWGCPGRYGFRGVRNWEAIKAGEKKKRLAAGGGKAERARSARLGTGRSFVAMPALLEASQAEFAGGARGLRLAERRRLVRQAARGNRRAPRTIGAIFPRPARARRAKGLPARAGPRCRRTCAPGWKKSWAISSLFW